MYKLALTQNLRGVHTSCSCSARCQASRFISTEHCSYAWPSQGPCMAATGHADDFYLQARIQANRDAADECAQKAAQFAKVRVQTQMTVLSG